VIKPIVYGTLMEFYSSGQPIMLEEEALPKDTQIHDDDPEPVQIIKELLEVPLGIASFNAVDQDKACSSI
jgi:hypothetical protein